jgi:hypothetical protein
VHRSFLQQRDYGQLGWSSMSRSRPTSLLCVQCRGRHDPASPCPCYRCGVVHLGECGEEFVPIANDRSCLICGSIHAVQLSCPCFRCGLRHAGDCYTVCPQCLQCHRPNQRVCSHFQMSNSRRVRARIEHSNLTESVSRVTLHSLGDMNVQCPHCRARFWPREKINCCRHGDIVIPELNDVPAVMSDIILCAHVRQHIRSYNTVMAFASTGHDNKSFPDGTFVLGGRSYHRIGPMLPNDGQKHVFSQIYMLDTENATHRRQEIMPTLRPFVLNQLHEIMLRHNRLAIMYKNAVDNVNIDDMRNVDVGFTWSASDELTNFEMGAIIQRDGWQRHVVLRLRDGIVRTISDSHQLYHALAYPLLFPTGCSGWHPQLQFNGR